MKLARLWQPRRGLFWLMVAFNVLSSVGAWALRTLPLNDVGVALIATVSLLNCGCSLLLAWRLVREPPPAGNAQADTDADADADADKA